jgi:hypothetical protein
MCTVSVIFDYGKQMPQQFWTQESFDQYMALLKAAKHFDDASGQPDCEDPTKTQWIEDIKTRLKQGE